MNFYGKGSFSLFLQQNLYIVLYYSEEMISDKLFIK